MRFRKRREKRKEATPGIEAVTKPIALLYFNYIFIYLIAIQTTVDALNFNLHRM